MFLREFSFLEPFVVFLFAIADGVAFAVKSSSMLRLYNLSYSLQLIETLQTWNDHAFLILHHQVCFWLLTSHAGRIASTAAPTSRQA